MRGGKQATPISDPLPISRGIFLTVLFVLVLVYWLFAFSLERVDAAATLNGIVQNRWPNAPPLPEPLVTFLSFFSPRVLRHFIPVITGWVLAYMAAVSLVRVLYDLPDYASARRFLGRLVGEAVQGVVVDVSAKTLPTLRKESELLRVGGPGMVKIPPGEVGVTELNGRFFRILPSGKQKLGRFEYLHAVIDLRTQEQHIEKLPLVTRDGIDLTVNVTLLFRVDPGGPMPTRENPFPYSPEAVRLVAYTEIVRGDGTSVTWRDVPVGAASGILTGLAAKYRLDELIYPDGRNEPLAALSQELTRNLRPPLADIGLELIRAHIGHLELPFDASQQYIDRWKAELDTRIQVALSGELANSQAEMDIARAEAEVIMIQAILEGLYNARRDGGVGTMREVIALRMVEALEKMAIQSQSFGPLPAHLLPQLLDWRQTLGPEKQLPAQWQETE